MTSTREQAARELGAWIVENDLAQVWASGDATLATDKRSYVVGFCKARTLDGTVQYFGPKFILVRWQTSYRDLPYESSRVFESVENVKKFLKLAFVDLNFDAAMSVPARMPKAKAS